MVLLHARRLKQFCRCGVEFACKMCVRDLAELCPEVSRYLFFVMLLFDSNSGLAARQGWNKKNGQGCVTRQPSSELCFLLWRCQAFV